MCLRLVISSLPPPSSPPAVSFLEVLPKDKKAKEERTAVLGQACLDLLPLLQQQQQQQQGGKTQLSLRLETEDGITSSTAGDTESAVGACVYVRSDMRIRIHVRTQVYTCVLCLCVEDL